MSDLITRLRNAVEHCINFQFSHSREAMNALQELSDAAEAGADELERQQAEIEKLRAALADLHKVLRERHYGRMPDEVQRAYDAAGAALKETP